MKNVLRLRTCALIVCSVLLAIGLPSDVTDATDEAPQHAVAAQTGDPVHDPPVDAPIIDPFRPPDGPYSPGNRGLEYDTTPGQEVRASAAGVVVFSGQVGGNLFVTIDHGGGLRTTVGFVESTLVVAGERVDRGALIARAGHTMHFTARRNGRYIDPELLFQQFRVVVRLVDGTER